MGDPAGVMGMAMRTLEQHYKHLLAYDPRVEKLAG